MGPVGHTLISSALGAGIWAATGSMPAAVMSLGVGVLMDLDHLYDYYNWYVKRKRDKVYLLLHAWEYSLVGLVLLGGGFFDTLLLAATLAHLLHVTADHFHNHMSRYGYSITYRLINPVCKYFKKATWPAA